MPAALGAAEHRLDAGHQLAGVEGLGHIVIGAQLQADDLVHVVGAGGEDDDGDVARLAQLAADLEAVHLRHHDVEDDQVGLVGLDLLQRLTAVIGGLDLESFLGEVEAGELDDIPLVVDDQDFGGHLITLYLYLTASPDKYRMGEPPRPAVTATTLSLQWERKGNSPHCYYRALRISP